MSDLEIQIARAVCYDCFYYTQSKESQFIMDMAERADREQNLPKDSPERQALAEKQREWLFALLHKYRRQIPALHSAYCTDKHCQLQMKNERKKLMTQLVLF